MQNHLRLSGRLVASCALAFFSVAGVTAGCGSSDTTAASGTSSGSTTTGSGGSGGSGTGTGTGTATGTGGMEAFCPPGSHPGALDCEADLKDWTAAPKIAHKRDHHVTLVATTPAGTFLYVVGGAGTGATLKQIERSTIAADGTLSAFADVAMMPEGLLGCGLAQVDRSFVIAGGLGDDSNSKTSVYVGQIADDGGVSFTKGPDLAASRYHVSLAYSQGFIYAMGGLFQSVSGGMPTQKIVDTIERAAFDGKTVSAWEMVAPLPVALTHHASIVYKDAIYVIGGGSDVAALPDILRATVSSAGALGPWENYGKLTKGLASPSVSIFLDQLYVFAGMTSLAGGEVASVERAPLDGMGMVGAFTALPPLPLARAHSHQTPIFKGHFYSVGGSKNHVPQAEVFNGTLQ
ncbi:MAG: hypothetical protein ABJE95_38945 [Byssovorax sp.]